MGGGKEEVGEARVVRGWRSARVGCGVRGVGRVRVGRVRVGSSGSGWAPINLPVVHRRVDVRATQREPGGDVVRAAAGARATRMSRLRAGDAAGGRGLGASPWDRTYDDHATAGAGQGVSPRARYSEYSASQLDAACAGYLLF